jgi:hypothetical protein
MHAGQQMEHTLNLHRVWGGRKRRRKKKKKKEKKRERERTS